MKPHVIEEMRDRFAARHTALVIVDMQRDFCEDGYGAHKAGRDLSAAKNIVGAVSRILAAAREAGAAVAHAAFSTLPDHGSDSGPWLAQRRRATASSAMLCIEGSRGAEFIDALTPDAGEWVVKKHRYSAFSGTRLDVLLRAKEIKSLIICGVSTNACVESTARAAIDLDYYVCVPPDATGSWDGTLYEAALANVNHRLGVTLPVDELIGFWKDEVKG